MIDINLIRENSDLVKENIKKKFQDEKLPLVDEVKELDERARSIQKELDDLNYLYQKKENRAVKREAFKTAQKEERDVQKAVDPERAKNVRAAKAEDIILISLLNNTAFYNKLKSDLTSDLFITPLNKKILSLIVGRIDDGLSVEISLLAPHLTSDEMNVVARLFADASVVSNTIEECVDCINVLKAEKSKQEKPIPSAMGDQEFLDFFASKKKSEDEKK